MQNFLIPCTKSIQEDNVEDSVKTYKNMVMSLKEIFEIPELVINTSIDYNIETLGKGRIRQTKERI